MGVLTKPVCVITGGARGMGAVTARALAAQGFRIIVADWDGESGHRTCADINRDHGDGAAEYVFCDLSDPASVAAFASTVRDRYDHLDVLINNAGITWPERRFSVTGQEMHFAVCHLGHFQLTGLLLPMLERASSGRIVVVSSEAHQATEQINFDDLTNAALWGGSTISHAAAFRAYSHAKLCNVLFMRELHERLLGSRITVNAVSPGFFINTGIHREMRGIFKLGAWLVFSVGALFNLNTAEKGARTHIWAAISDDVSGVGGKYFHACRERVPNSLVEDSEVRGRLWRESEALLSGVPASRACE